MSYSFVDGRFVFPDVPTVDSHGKQLLWKIEVYMANADDPQTMVPIRQNDLNMFMETPPPGMVAVIQSTHGVKDGPSPPQVSREIVLKGKGKVRGDPTKTRTNVLSQALSQAASKHRNKSKLTTEVDSHGRFPPILVNAVVALDFSSTQYLMSPKLDGERCVARFVHTLAPDVPVAKLSMTDIDNGLSRSAPADTRSGAPVDVVERKDITNTITAIIGPPAGPQAAVAGAVELYSRTLREHPFETPISEEFHDFYVTHPTERTLYFDGELYIHGKLRQFIQSIVSSEERDETVQYYVFDCWTPGNESEPYALRYKRLKSFTDYFTKKMPHVHVIEPVFKAVEQKDVDVFYKWCLDKKYEGTVIRDVASPYTYSYNKYHARDVMKLKPFDVDNFTIVDFTEGSKGKDVGAVIWICVTEDALRFNVVPNMTLQERYEIFNQLSTNTGLFDIRFKGKQLEVMYRTVSEKGIPQQPKGVRVVGN